MCGIHVKSLGRFFEVLPGKEMQQGSARNEVRKLETPRSPTWCRSRKDKELKSRLDLQIRAEPFAIEPRGS